MATQKKNLQQRLADRKIVEFNRGLIESLEESDIRELVEDYIAHPAQSVGARFVGSVESTWRKPVLAEADGVVNIDVTVKEIIAVIAGESSANNGVITVGRRSDKRTFYVRWSSQMQGTEEVRIRDPFRPSGLLERYNDGGTIVYLGKEPYDAAIADADGHLVVEQDVYVLLCLSWQTGEAQPVALATVNQRLLDSESEGKEVTAASMATFFPEAHKRLIQLKGEKRGRDWARYIDSLMDSSEAPSGGSMPPFVDDSEIVVGFRGQQIDLTLARWHELGLAIRGPLVNELTKLQIMGNISERFTLFNGGLRRFQASTNFDVNAHSFATQILMAVERYGDPTLWEELMRIALNQPDTSPNLRHIIEVGDLPGKGGDVVVGNKFVIGGDNRGATFNIGTNITGDGRK